MSLISMCCHDTAENKRTEYTKRTLDSILATVDLNKHRLIIVDNASCEETKNLLSTYKDEEYWYNNHYNIKIITNEKNIGTAEAINLAWRERKEGENCVKIDNDVVIHSKGWVDELEEVVKREPKIGQVGLKRKDLAESPNQTEAHYKSELIMLPHVGGERWIVVEKCKHIMGTCLLHSSALLEKVGYLKQPTIYGFDDSLMSLRANLAGFMTVFLPHILIDHIDVGGDAYCKWKQDKAAEDFRAYADYANEYTTGKTPIYYNPFKK